MSQNEGGGATKRGLPNKGVALDLAGTTVFQDITFVTAGPASERSRSAAEGVAVAYFFYNTDADSLARQGRYPVLLRVGFAATSGPISFGEQLTQLAPGDVLLMYENRVGVVAAGTVLGYWDGATHRPGIYYYPGADGLDHEYRIPVAWWLDLSGCPVGLDELRDRLGYTPRGTITPIVSRQAEVEQLIAERRAALAPRSQTPNQALQQTAGA